MSVGAASKRDPFSRTHVHYVCLTNDVEVREALKELGLTSWNLVPHRPTTLTGALMLARGGNMAMVVAVVGDPAAAGGPLSRSVAGRTFVFPPVLAIVDRAPEAHELEAFRRQGVSHVAVRPLAAERDAKPFAALSRSMSWLNASLERMPIPDVLQTMASHRQSGMILVTNQATPPLTDVPWEEIGDPVTCGRLYVLEGELRHAETPSADGVKALAEMLRFGSGALRINEVFIPPLSPNLRGALHTILLDAAWHNDERNRPREGPLASLPPPTTWLPPASSVHPTTIAGDPVHVLEETDIEVVEVISPPSPAEGADTMSNLDSLLKFAPDLRTAAKADRAGRVLESAGTGDAESMCAVVAIGAPALDRVSELMGLGGRRGFSFTSQKLALYVHERADGFIVAVGEATKNSDTTFSKMAESVTPRPRA